MDPSPAERRRDRLAFYPVAVVGAIFCITILIVITADFGEQQQANPVSQWVQDHATGVLLFETLLLVTLGLLAMFIDRMRTLRKIELNRQQSPDDAGGDDGVG